MQTRLGEVPALPDAIMSPRNLYNSIIHVSREYLTDEMVMAVSEAIGMADEISEEDHNVEEFFAEDVCFAGRRVTRGYVYLGLIAKVLEDAYLEKGRSPEDPAIAEQIGLALIVLESMATPKAAMKHIPFGLSKTLIINNKLNREAGRVWVTQTQR